MTKKSRRDSHAENEQADIQVGGWVDRAAKTVDRKFPGGKAVDVPLRIELTRQAHAEILEHAKETTDRELCGVMLGTICRDEHGVWACVEKALRGETEKQGGTHVTYTHKTWEKIYAVKDAEYPNLSILGWYHTHPGFGVQFSEMDLFIQRNFFSGDTQFALVVDPISDEQAVIVNQPAGKTEYVKRMWIDGKESPLQIPESVARQEQKLSGQSESASPEVLDRLKQVEQRLDQVLQATEQQRESHGRLLLFFGFFAGLLLTGAIVYSVFSSIWKQSSPPENLEMVEVPVKINDQVMMVGLRVEGWKIPDGENILKKMENEAQRRALEAAIRIMQAPDSPESKQLIESTKQTSLLSPAVTYWWAVIATLALIVLLTLRLFSRGSSHEPI